MKSKQSPIMLSLMAGPILLIALLWATGQATLGTARPVAQITLSPSPALPNASLRVSRFTIPNQDIICSVNVTTTDKAPTGNHSLTNASLPVIANYVGQSLLVSDTVNVPDSNAPVDVATQADFYRLDNAQINYQYTIQAKPDKTNNYNLGIVVYDSSYNELYSDIDTSNYSAIVSFKATTEGPYFIKVYQLTPQCTGSTYALIYSSPVAPTGTPTPTNTPTPKPTTYKTPTPVPTWPTGFDQYEPNFSFESATSIAPGIAYSLNFKPWGGADVDNDFFKIRVKPGLQLTCMTSDLDPAVDPRMVFYTGPGEEYHLAANDDIQLGNFNSRISYYAAAESYIYILVGQGDRMDLAAASNSNYKLTCELNIPGTTTPAANDKTYPTPYPAATATPIPTQSSASPVATPTPPTPTMTPEPANSELTIRLLTTPAPSVPTPTPTGFRSFRVVVYYDENQDGLLGAGEGISGFFVRVLASQTQEELARGYTDEQGQLAFTVPTVNTVRVLIPLLGFDRLLEPTIPESIVRIAPPTLPDTIP
ncbi:MAG: hypothetical protein JXA33_07640 [Anaerolineae bacterium]|nr:hypothetical protein [Anaerolineae bacterium]